MGNGDIYRRQLLTGAGAAGVGVFALGTGDVTASERGEYNVGTDSPAAEKAARDAADAVVRVLDWGAGEKTVTGTYSEEAIDRLERRPDVRYTEVNGEMEAISLDSSDSEVPWGVDRVDAEKVHADGETGGDDGGTDIAIIDTGIDSDHPDLKKNLGKGKAFVDCKGGPGVECNKPWDDDEGHGTHCAGIADADENNEGVVGVSTAATLHAVKVLDNSGSGSYSDVAAGIEWTADQGYDVGSMSLGGGKSSTVEDACEYAYGKGVLLVAAAGNDGPCTDCVSYPAAEPEVIAVSATDKDDTLADYSSTGPEIELAGPGTDVYSTYVGGDYATLSGTSMACPHVSGAGGQLMDNGYSNTEARTRLQDTAEDLAGDGSGDNNKFGYGLLDVEAAVTGSTDSAPSVSWVNPNDGETVSGTITIQIDASDSEDSDDSLDVTYNVDGGSSRSTSYNSTSGYYEDSLDTTQFSDGDHAFEANATDSAGNTSTATITVTTDNTDNAPSVSWVSPQDGDTVSGSVALEIDASDDRDSESDLTVEWQVDDGTWNTASYNSTSGNYEDSWDSTRVSDGDHNLDARATDTGGNVSAEARITVTVSNSSSAPTVDSLSLSEDNSGGSPHAEFDASWDVGDSDGDLDTVDLTLYELDSNGNRVETEDSASIDVGGSDASGTTELKAKFDENTGATYEVECVVTDSNGDTASDTATEVEDGS